MQRFFAHALAHFGVVADGFGDDVVGSGQRFGGGGSGFGEVGLGEFVEAFLAAGLGQDEGGERFQPFFAGDGGACAPFGFVGLVEVFQGGEGIGGQEGGVEFRGEFFLGGDGGDVGRGWYGEFVSDHN